MSALDSDDLTRLRTEYARRANDPRYRDWYSPFNPANILITQERDRAIARILARYTDKDLSACRVLDVGCDSGNELAKFIGYGASATDLFGLDLLWDRVQQARDKHSNLTFVCGNAESMPYRDDTFDVVLQFTLFTSILDDNLRQRIASEMLRVLKPRGLILWYDYRWNPTNPQTRGITPREIRQLFSACEFEFHRITLAPPIARRIVPVSWTLAMLLEKLKLLSSHYLVGIRPT